MYFKTLLYTLGIIKDHLPIDFKTKDVRLMPLYRPPGDVDTNFQCKLKFSCKRIKTTQTESSRLVVQLEVHCYKNTTMRRSPMSCILSQISQNFYNFNKRKVSNIIKSRIAG